jgi:hypothetical protein
MNPAAPVTSMSAIVMLQNKSSYPELGVERKEW